MSKVLSRAKKIYTLSKAKTITMGIRIIVAGETQCELFAEICLVADYLDQQLPNFCYEQIEKPVLDWKTWLSKVNIKNKWHHDSSPLVWKELMIKGSKPYYIGGASEFLEYCHSYYNFDVFFSPKVFGDLSKSFSQYRKKIRQDSENVIKPKTKKAITAEPEAQTKNDFTVCIYGAAYPLTMNVISGLLDISEHGKCISKIYLYDDDCSPEFMQFVETECNFIGTNHPGKVVKYVNKIGIAFTNSDMLIIMRHVQFEMHMSIGDWLHKNEEIMHELALMIDACASRKMYILFANLGPACYNATVLMNSITAADQMNIVVATSGIGLNTLSVVADIAKVPIKNIFCPVVWGFVGINHLVDIRTTLHKYNSFEPYNRYTKVKSSTLNIGCVTPEIRTMEYLMYFDESLWMRVAEKKSKIPKDEIDLHEAVAALNVVKLWLFNPNPDVIINLGIPCDGSFGLTFKGAFSQPCRFKNNRWQPASEYMLPRDQQMNIYYLEKIAKMMMQLKEGDLPPIIPYNPCICRPKLHKKKGVW